ncbi:hypothetical protein ACWDR0_05420 [Streptomyces sp. NPDC003691]
MSTVERPRRWISLMAVIGLSAVACAGTADTGVHPERVLMAVEDVQDDSCGPWNTDGAKAAGKNRGAAKASLIRWETPDGCEVGMSAFAYGDTGDAKSAFKDEGPRQWWGDIWPYDPVKVEVDIPLSADAHELLCIGGSEKQGCFNWSYWARYGSHLVELESFGLDRQDRYVSRETFMRTLGNADRRIASALKADQ